ncbi:translocation/assembly module TamB domain-containing protein [Sphingomonas sp. ASV193]|uniref:translocation/assembly module TamB domain-containing protein n=1 Tax=Sphingomonas sp. ASV193 TaxID=3144405 RepID=UPI0032E910EA
MSGDEVRVVVVRRSWGRRLVGELLALLLSLVILLIVGLVAIDTAPGHRFLVDRIGQIETASGLKIRIARIDGSIFGTAHLRGVTVADPRGVFAASPDILLDWAPGAWLYNDLHIDRLETDRLVVSRLPALRPSGKAGAILPGFDIHIGKLTIRRLELGKAVAGRAMVAALEGHGDVRAGRALVVLDGRSSAGDRLAINLDSAPDRDRFNLGVEAHSPAAGLLPGLFGSVRPVDLVVAGKGSWSQWRGAAEMRLSGRKVGALALHVDQGTFRLGGALAPAPFLDGKLQRLTAPAIRVDGEGNFAGRLFDGRVKLASPALRAVAIGKVDLAAGEWHGVRLGVDLLRPQALFPNMTGRDIRLLATLDGRFATADFSYRLTSPHLAFDATGFDGVMATGRGTLSKAPLRVPLRLSARALTGVGDVAEGILRNLTIDGVLLVSSTMARGDDLLLSSDKVKGRMSLMIDFATGRFDLVIAGGLTRYLVPGLGIVDVTTRLHVVPGPNGQTRIVGNAEAWVRRLDNGFLRDLAGGLPHLTTDLERTGDGVLHFTNLRLNAPKLALAGQGVRRNDGSFHIEAKGRQAKYGPILSLVLDGPIDRPKVELLLASPNEALGARMVRLGLVPNAAGYAFTASGQSKAGPFTATGAILLPKGGATAIDIAALNVAGTTARGRLTSLPGGLSGTLALAGGGIDGTIGLAPAGADQQVDLHLSLVNASLPGPPPVAIRQGRVDGRILVGDRTTNIVGTLVAKGVSSGSLSLASLTASASLVNGAGEVRAALAGRRGNAFDFAAVAQVGPGGVTLTGKGSIDGKPLTIDGPMRISAAGDGWDVAPTRVRFGGGAATLSGRTGSNPVLHADVAAMPLQLLDIVAPKLGLGGVASGRLDYAWNGGRPTGRADLKVRGLSRSGLVLASQPIDVGLAALLQNGQAAMRAVAVAGGKTIGRAQARFTPVGGGPVLAALMAAPMELQLRYAGPADTLWRLSGVETFDLSGPIAVGANIGGRLTDPVIRGAIAAQNARLESPVTGTVIEGLKAQGTFDGSRLLLSSLSGATPGGGAISGGGSIDFAGGAPALNLSFQAQKAQLLDRDDIAATVTGPLRIRSNGSGGTISGQLTLDSGAFTLGRASAASKVPQLGVRDVNVDPGEVIEVQQLSPWKLDLAIAGRNLKVRGLGIDSLWSTNLKVGGSADSPALSGTANLVRGNYDFAGRSFRLERGVIRFRGESPPDPQLDIRATAQVQGLDAAVTVTGSGNQPDIQFSSVPALPQDELLSRLLFGTSITNLSAPEALQLASAVAAFRSGKGGLDPINAVRRAVGLDRLRILPADISTGQKTAISAGKYIGRKLFVEVITDGQGYSATRIEYQVTRWLSLLSSVSTIGRTSANVRVSKDY